MQDQPRRSRWVSGPKLCRKPNQIWPKISRNRLRLDELIRSHFCSSPCFPCCLSSPSRAVVQLCHAYEDRVDGGTFDVFGQPGAAHPRLAFALGPAAAKRAGLVATAATIRARRQRWRRRWFGACSLQSLVSQPLLTLSVAAIASTKKKAVSLAYAVLLCSPCCLVVQFRFRCLLWQNPLSGAVKSTLPGPREGSSV